MKKLLQREIRVAFDRKTQPVWKRLVKYALLGLLIYLFGNSSAFWWIFGFLLVAGIGLHVFYRYKTHGWTRSYGRGILRWDYDRVFGTTDNIPLP